jgi:hypothetical protein
MIGKSQWTIRSNTGSNQLVGVFTLVLGIPCVLLTIHNFKSSANTMAGFCLGILLIGAGVFSLLFLEEISTTVDPERRRLIIEKKSRVGHKTSVVGFDEIASVLVNSAGGHEGPKNYHLKISLKNGKTDTTGRWSLDQGEIVAIAGQLAAEIGCESNPGLIVHPINATQIVYSGIGAVILYPIWFRIWVGPWCPAMWFGTAPPVIILIAFFGILGILRILPRR